jgi:tRNA nucleotidyltransferase (CCA-adding enzyme)
MSAKVPERLVGATFPAPVLEVIRTLRGGGFAAFLVGGCIRDLMLGKAPKDFDVATAAHPAQVQKLFRKVIPTGIEHGTVTVLTRGESVEVTTFRTEAEYLDGRRPSRVEFHTEIEADLSRRDFTINAMAFDPVATVWADPFGGEADLAAGKVRCVGKALDRFSEDGLRPLRAVRFATVLGFALDEGTAAAIPQTLEVFEKVALERVNQELVKLLLSAQPGRGALLLADTGLLSRFLPELPKVELPRAAALDRSPESLEVRLAILLEGVAAPRDVLFRLKFPNKVAEEVQNLLAHPIPELVADDVALRRWMSGLGRASVPTALSLARAGEVPSRLAAAERAEQLLAQNPPLATRELALQGKAIMDLLGVGPSPHVGAAARFLLGRVLEDPGLNQPALLAAELQKWAKAQGL